MTQVTPLRWQHVGLVAVGGAFGTAAREGAILLWPAGDGLPVAVFGVNVLGALLLGALYALLGRRRETERARAARALLGAGVLGGFTTYSALAGDTARLWEQNAGIAFGYAAVSVLAGVAAAALGLRLGAGRRADTA
ncbi:MAG TPA: CrcB family protein [Microbacterium sp.]|uniref:CrcB family protein n=1 Tax=Microbacterium sp. TaxID=51671 RepID=UPI002B823088|nr:CrcB family protein [Microbacterium sp.]HWI32459.1 CrcB family protein [Microbacterium sp.]